MTSAASAVTTSDPLPLATSAASSRNGTSRCPTDFAVLARGYEIGGKPQVVDEDRLALQSVGLLAADVDRASGLRQRRGVRRDPGFLPGLLDYGRRHGLSDGDAATDEVVEHARIDRLVRAAPGDPHGGLAIAADEAVHVHRVGADPEVPGGGAFELEPRRRAERRRKRRSARCATR